MPDAFEEQLGKPAWGEDSPSRQSARLLVAIAKGKPIVKDEMDLGELASTGGLVNVLLSEHFRAALKSGGKPGDEVLAQIRTAVTPNRDTYYDFSNGDLNWNW